MSTPELLIVAGDLDPSRGGQERSIREVISALDRTGIRPALAAPRRPDDLPLSAFHEIDAGTGSRATRWRRLLDSADRIAEASEAQRVLSHLPTRCDYYLPRGGLYPEAFARSAASHASALRRLTSATFMNAGRRELLRRERTLLTADDGPLLIALSAYVAEQGVRHYALSNGRIRVIPNGIDTARVRDARPVGRASLGLDDGDVVLLAAAHNPRLKGIPQLERAVRSLGRSDVKLVLAGGPRGGPEDGVIRLGPREDLPGLLATADVLVHPTFYDPSSRIVLEAMAAGVPVITTRWNGAVDVLGDGGLVIDDPRDTKALAAAIDRLLDPATRRRCRDALSDETVAARVSSDRHARDLVELIAESTN